VQRDRDRGRAEKRRLDRGANGPGTADDVPAEVRSLITARNHEIRLGTERIESTNYTVGGGSIDSVAEFVVRNGDVTRERPPDGALVLRGSDDRHLGNFRQRVGEHPQPRAFDPVVVRQEYVHSSSVAAVRKNTPFAVVNVTVDNRLQARGTSRLVGATPLFLGLPEWSYGPETRTHERGSRGARDRTRYVRRRETRSGLSLRRR